MKFLLKSTVALMFAVFVGGIGSQGQDLSPTVKRLKEQVDQGKMEAILEAADTGDLTLIPYLERLSSNLEGRNNGNHPSFFAHVALAKLGNADALQQILVEIDNESPAIQDSGMKKLKLIGGNVAFKKFYELLDDTKPRPNTECQKMFEEHNKKHLENKLTLYCDVVYFSRSTTAMFLLKGMVDHPPVTAIYGTQEEIDRWKEWLRINKSLN